MRRWLWSCLCTSVLLATARADEDPGLEFRGGSHAYGGTTIHRAIAWTDDAASIEVAWRLQVFGATVAEGSQTVTRNAAVLEVDVPPVERNVPATLLLRAGSRRLVVRLKLHPPLGARVRAAFGEAAVGWVGEPTGLRAGPEAIDLPRTALRSALDIGRFRGAVVVVPPGVGDVSPLVPALLRRARTGAHVLALGVDGAPWIDASNPDTRGSSFATPFGNEAGRYPELREPVGRAGTFWKSPLKAGEGNHLDLVDDLVRRAWLGKGTFTVVRARLLETLADEPRAAWILAVLLEDVPDEPTPRWPSRVEALGGGLPPTVRALFGRRRDDEGLGVQVVVGDATPGPAKGLMPVLVLREDRSYVGAEDDRFAGPGWRALEGPERPDLCRFLTRNLVRIQTETFWRR